MTQRTVLAIDIGAESGRALGVGFDGTRLSLEEMHRFANIPVQVRETLHWDVLRLWHDVQDGIARATAKTRIDAIGLDTWAVDFALLDAAGNLIGNPVHYRDARTNGMMDQVFAAVPRAEVFARTGIQMLPFNTLYQLASMVKAHHPALRSAQTFLTVPDLLYYWLTGVKALEYTNATTTQCFNVGAQEWATDVLTALDIPTHLFGEVIDPGQILGKVGEIPVVVAPHHDTGSAVIGVPAQIENFAYLSSGTWSLLGMELREPVINDAALQANVTNEGGYGGTIRLLKNIMGLWLIQQAKRTWDAEGQEHSYSELADLARSTDPFVSLIDPDHPAFLAPGDMPTRIREFCKQHGEPIPASIGAMSRCIFESLALKYRYVLELLIMLTGRQVDVLHIVGGGSQNALLCQMTADATGRTVLAGPVEATALGNALTQLIALGSLRSVEEGRRLIRDSFPLRVYEPEQTAAWTSAYGRFSKLLPPTA